MLEASLLTLFEHALFRSMALPSRVSVWFLCSAQESQATFGGQIRYSVTSRLAPEVANNPGQTDCIASAHGSRAILRNSARFGALGFRSFGSCLESRHPEFNCVSVTVYRKSLSENLSPPTPLAASGARGEGSWIGSRNVIYPGNSGGQAHFSASAFLQVVANSRRKMSQTPVCGPFPASDVPFSPRAF